MGATSHSCAQRSPATISFLFARRSCPYLVLIRVHRFVVTAWTIAVGRCLCQVGCSMSHNSELISCFANSPRIARSDGLCALGQCDHLCELPNFWHPAGNRCQRLGLPLFQAKSTFESLQQLYEHDSGSFNAAYTCGTSLAANNIANSSSPRSVTPLRGLTRAFETIKVAV